MTRAPISLPQQRDFLKTTRRDLWWLFPAITLVYFLSFIVYSTWAAFQGSHYWFDGGGAHYLSPMYSPVLWDAPGMISGHALFSTPWPDWLWFLPVTSPALLILWAPGGFRFTCYYYRGAYYKAFWADPINCAVGEPRKGYWGERWLPLVLQNVHRYFLYLALIFIVILTYDAIKSYIFVGPDGGHHFGMGIGSLVITANAVLLAGYTFGCHSLRHLIGGKKDCVSASPARHGAYKCVTCFNRGHMIWAWISLFWVGFTDLYIRLCSMGIWSDWRIL